jgi:hypothetical protein
MPRDSRYFRPTLGLAGAFATLFVLCGCVSTAQGTENSEPDIGKTPQVLSTKGLRLPLDSYLPTEAQVREFDQARLVLIDRCMNRFGFSYQVDLPDVPSGAKDSNSRRYGITDSDLAAKRGYGLAAGDASTQAHPANPKLDADGQTALYGEGSSVVKGKPVPLDGCLGEANRGLDAHSPKGADFNAAQQLSLTSYQQSQQDSRVRKVVAAWSTCMAGQGYHYANPLAPLADPKLGDGSTPEAVKTATADLACKQRTNLVGVWSTVESAYQQRLIDQHADLVNATKEARDARLRIADSLSKASPN